MLQCYNVTDNFALYTGKKFFYPRNTKKYFFLYRAYVFAVTSVTL